MLLVGGHAVDRLNLAEPPLPLGDVRRDAHEHTFSRVRIAKHCSRDTRITLVVALLPFDQTVGAETNRPVRLKEVVGASQHRLLGGAIINLIAGNVTDTDGFGHGVLDLR
jgi:hypothetical protein